MDVMITKETVDTVTCFTAICGKKTAKVIIGQHDIQVICMNASATRNRYHLPVGKFFETFDKAIENYKSTEMKTILNTIRSELGV